MKKVQLSEKDRAILKGCAIGSVVGKAAIDELRSLLKASQKIKIDSTPGDIEKADGTPAEYQLEDAELMALKKLCESGREMLRKTVPVLSALLACIDHLEAATDVPADG